MKLTSVERVLISMRVLQPTLDFLAERGAQGHEGFVVWGARIRDQGTTLEFTSPYVPHQTAHTTTKGLLVTVDGAALDRMNRAFYARGEIAAGQVHSHPTDAYHSETDDHFPLITLRGAISLVVPDFAQHGLASSDRWAWYRLLGLGEWESLPPHVQVAITEEDA